MEDIGIRLKKFRETYSLSQRQLAKSSGVSNAMICLIERGKSKPSLGLLKNILDVFQISISEFFSLELQEEPAKVFYGKDELTEIGDGLISYPEISPDGKEFWGWQPLGYNDIGVPYADPGSNYIPTSNDIDRDADGKPDSWPEGWYNENLRESIPV